MTMWNNPDSRNSAINQTMHPAGSITPNPPEEKRNIDQEIEARNAAIWDAVLALGRKD